MNIKTISPLLEAYITVYMIHPKFIIIISFDAGF
jgi:hypothetical protein